MIFMSPKTAVSPEWGDRLDVPVIRAIKDKKLLPIAELDRGFVRPKYAAQVVVSYFQAGRICDYIQRNWSYDKLLAMMHDFARNMSTPDVVRVELGIEPKEFDKRFLAWVEGPISRPPFYGNGLEVGTGCQPGNPFVFQQVLHCT